MSSKILGFAVILRCSHVIAGRGIPITWRMVRGKPWVYCPYCSGDA